MNLRKTSAFLRHLKAHRFVQQGCFSFFIFLQLWWPIEPKFLQICYFNAYVGIRQVRILVFDNYQTCPVPLRGIAGFLADTWIQESNLRSNCTFVCHPCMDCINNFGHTQSLNYKTWHLFVLKTHSGKTLNFSVLSIISNSQKNVNFWQGPNWEQC